MNTQILEIAQRIQGMRLMLDLTVEQMAQAVDLSVEEYLQFEQGLSDYPFSFLYKCASQFGIDIAELVTGEPPKLSFYSVVRRGEGMPIKRRHGFDYLNLGYLMRNKVAEPFYVTAKYEEEAVNQPIALSTHKGQEFDYILRGTLKVQLEEHTEVLTEGDSIYYDSDRGHGMIAVGGRDCEFLAIVMREE